MSAAKSRAYTNAIISLGSSSRAVIRFTCVNCAHELEIANNDPRKHGSFFAQQARRRGWDTDGHAISRVFCPDCRKTPAFRSRRQVELDSVVLPAMDEPLTIEGYAEPALALPPKEAVSMSREPTITQQQRMQIRSLLDKHFDDKDGCYLPSDAGAPMSDQAIGHIVGVPWAEVTRIREAAYGKIRVDPAFLALSTQFAELEKRVEEMRLALNGFARQRVVND